MWVLACVLASLHCVSALEVFPPPHTTIVLGTFCGTSWGEWSFCLNVKENITQQCIGQNSTTISGSTWSAKMHYKQIPYILLHQQQSWEQSHGAPQPGFVSIPQPSSAAQSWPLSVPIPGWLQENAEAMSYFITKANLRRRVVLSLVLLLPASLTPSCSWAFLFSMPDHSSVTYYHCWTVTIRVSPSIVFTVHHCFPTQMISIICQWSYWSCHSRPVSPQLEQISSCYLGH